MNPEKILAAILMLSSLVGANGILTEILCAGLLCNPQSVSEHLNLYTQRAGGRIWQPLKMANCTPFTLIMVFTL